MFLIRMPFLSIIEHTTQDILPMLDYVRVVEPVFVQHWDDLVFHNLLHPLFRAVLRCAVAEITVADAESLAEGSVAVYRPVQFFDALDQSIEGFIIQLLLIGAEAVRIERRIHGKEAETPAQSIVNEGK